MISTLRLEVEKVDNNSEDESQIDNNSETGHKTDYQL